MADSTWLILSHTTLPDPSRVPALKKGVKLMEWLPEGLLRWIFKKRLAGLLPRTPETDEFRAYTLEVTGNVTKAGLEIAWQDSALAAPIAVVAARF